MRVVEIFRSIQGEGANMGTLVSFVRLAGCNLNCWYCDTEWESGNDLTLEQIRDELQALKVKRIIWTGGEPTMQLTDEVVQYFKELGYWQAIETNGTATPPKGLDYITCSPKVGVHVLRKSFADRHVGEFRFPYGKDVPTPPSIDALPPADHYLLSPIFTGREGERMQYEPEHLDMCLELMSRDPRWRLSLQVHKLLAIP